MTDPQRPANGGTRSQVADTLNRSIRDIVRERQDLQTRLRAGYRNEALFRAALDALEITFAAEEQEETGD